MRATALRRARLTEELRSAIVAKDFRVVLQPQLDIRNGHHHGFEALVRWEASGGEVPPAELISVAEESGLVASLSYAIIEKALVTVQQAKQQGLHPGVISFNTVASQLYDPGFPGVLRALLDRYGVTPGEVELEVTENVILDRSADLIADAIRSLRQAGFSIALDDFGTGYASLTHLKQLPLDKLKIDRSFVSGVGAKKSGGDYIISRTIVSLAHNLGFKVVAEGIETEDQYFELMKIGCDLGQGYLLGAPMDPGEVLDYLAGLEVDKAGSRAWAPLAVRQRHSPGLAL